MRKKLTPKQYLTEMNQKLGGENQAEMTRRWLAQGYKEQLTEVGEWIQVEITPDERRRLEQALEFYSAPKPSRAEVFAKADLKYEAMLAQADSCEALVWLEGLPKETLAIAGGQGEGDGLFRDEALELVRSILESGAEQVFAVAIEELSTYEQTEWLVVECPLEKHARLRLFKKIRQLSRRYLWDAPVDEGQKYLGLRWD